MGQGEVLGKSTTWNILSKSQEHVRMINKDQPALDFEMSDVQGRTIRLSDYRGKRNIVLVFLRGFM
jgi:hypothetical protein